MGYQPRPLPSEEWVFHTCGPDHIAVAMHVNGPAPGYLYWTKMVVADLPNDQVAIEDLAKVEILADDAAALARGEFAKPSFLTGL